MLATRVLKQPISGAVCISLSLHGLLFALKPGFSNWYQAQNDAPLTPISVSLTQAKTDTPPPLQFPNHIQPSIHPVSGDDLLKELAEQPARPGPTHSQDNPWEQSLDAGARVAMLAPVELAFFEGPGELPRPLDAAQLPLAAPEVDMLQTRVAGWQNALSSMAGPQAMRWEEGEHSYEAQLVQVEPADSTALGEARVKVTRSVNGQRQQTEMHFKQLAFSHFTQFVDRWRQDVVMSREHIEGRFHSNSGIRVAVSPKMSARVSGEVTVASHVLFEGLGSRANLFPGGLVTGAEPIPMPEHPFGDSPPDATAANVHYLDQDSHVVFADDGSYTWSTTQQPETVHRTQLPDKPWLISAAEGVTVFTQGVVRGQVALYSPNGITVTGDLLYARDPRDSANSTDHLSLITDGIVEVAGPSVTGPGDLTIFASIYAGKQFRVRAYHVGGHALLTLYGSVTAGTLSATEPRFVCHIFYDRRLEYSRAPHYPLTRRFAFDRWDPVWKPVDTTL